MISAEYAAVLKVKVNIPQKSGSSKKNHKKLSRIKVNWAKP
jgi:hypothetical protein